LTSGVLTDAELLDHRDKLRALTTTLALARDAARAGGVEGVVAGGLVTGGLVAGGMERAGDAARAGSAETARLADAARAGRARDAARARGVERAGSAETAGRARDAARVGGVVAEVVRPPADGWDELLELGDDDAASGAVSDHGGTEGDDDGAGAGGSDHGAEGDGDGAGAGGSDKAAAEGDDDGSGAGGTDHAAAEGEDDAEAEASRGSDHGRAAVAVVSDTDWAGAGGSDSGRAEGPNRTAAAHAATAVEAAGQGVKSGAANGWDDLLDLGGDDAAASPHAERTSVSRPHLGGGVSASGGAGSAGVAAVGRGSSVHGQDAAVDAVEAGPAAADDGAARHNARAGDDAAAIGASAHWRHRNAAAANTHEATSPLHHVADALAHSTAAVAGAGAGKDAASAAPPQRDAIGHRATDPAAAAAFVLHPAPDGSPWAAREPPRSTNQTARAALLGGDDGDRRRLRGLGALREGTAALVRTRRALAAELDRMDSVHALLAEDAAALERAEREQRAYGADAAEARALVAAVAARDKRDRLLVRGAFALLLVSALIIAVKRVLWCTCRVRAWPW
jgi:hypothetical protein